MDAESVRLDQAGSEVALTLKELEQRSRARLDAGYRAAMIEKLTDRYLARQAESN